MVLYRLQASSGPLIDSAGRMTLEGEHFPPQSRAGLTTLLP
jgi:hypothetical protein